MHDLESPADSGPQRSAEKPLAKGMFPAALSVPKLRADYEKLYRDRKVSETTLVFALERLESARATAARDVSTFVVLDPPTLPDRHSRPRAPPTLAISTTLGLLAAVAWQAWSFRRRPAQPADNHQALAA